MAKPPLFLRPTSYKRRRRHDVARLLPCLGSFLFLLPILWGPVPGDEDGRGIASDAIYLFLIWAGLILAAGLIARKLGGPGEADDPEAESDLDFGR